MRREDFEHVIAAAADVAGENEIVVIGSQAILGTYPDAPASLLVSMEVDVYPRRHPEKADQIDGAMGDGSPFQGAYGYYARGVGPETARPPSGWEDRLVEFRIPPRPSQRGEVVAFCLEPHDLVLAKCVAGRDRDWDFAREALVAHLVALDELERRIGELPIESEQKDHVRKMLAGIAGSEAL